MAEKRVKAEWNFTEAPLWVLIVADPEWCRRSLDTCLEHLADKWSCNSALLSRFGDSLLPSDGTGLLLIDIVCLAELGLGSRW
ncbi:hypothetical protein C487_00295 [Natrinema pallidum DSM 3751]|uniref:Uncharacterized protein n=1 Tax=Natrinema pallidum DSM 3751 TaxID=1227495 RepID=L9ZB94_9EURY|nr:hypothetical protein C487_00295 [Natrinema pallidum DSM 3751]